MVNWTAMIELTSFFKGNLEWQEISARRGIVELLGPCCLSLAMINPGTVVSVFSKLFSSHLRIVPL
jgi:hypothetical protein